MRRRGREGEKAREKEGADSDELGRNSADEEVWGGVLRRRLN